MKIKKILVIHNPRAGFSQIRLKDYLKALETRGASPVLRTLSDDCNFKEVLKDASDFERVVVAGGDGTVSSAAAVLQGTGIPLAAYPAGTANLLALNLKMPATADKLAEVTLKGPVIPTDLGRLDYRAYRRRDYLRARLGLSFSHDLLTNYFAIMAGSGVVAHLVKGARPFKRRFGKAAYWLSAFLNLYPRVAKFRLKIDGRTVHARGIGVIIVNFEKIQFDLKVVPGCDARDGEFEVVILKGINLFELIPAVWSVIIERLGFRRLDVSKKVEVYHGSEIEVSSWPPLKLQFDGEMLRRTNFFKAKVLPRAVHFVYGTAAS